MYIQKEELDRLCEEYPIGTRVRLVKMDDVQAPPAGTEGVVRSIDCVGTIHISWQNGSGLGAVYGEDVIEKIV